MARILIAEDEPRIASFLEKGLRANGFTTIIVDDGPTAASVARDRDFDLVVLDLGLPGRDGLDVLSEVRRRGEHLPVVILTARDGIEPTVEGFELGADDFITKPFAFEELLARVEALARRPKAIASPVLKVRDLELNKDTREVRRDGELIDVTPKEFTVLEYLMRHQGRVMSRTLITEYAWGYHFDPGTNIVDVVINHLRKKVDAKASRKLIQTVRGVGYSIRD
ncbi:MAG: response regulator transcription factor [Acidimicrobiia bacterium]